MLAGLSPARRRLVVAVLALVTAAVVALGVLLVTRGADVEGPGPQARPGPVLLVPGYGGGTTSLLTLADRLEQAGRDATVVPLPGDGTGDLGEAAAALDEAARAALERTGEESVDVVGYSAGGVIARLWVADGGAEVARRVVTLGSPHHGTGLADLAGQIAPASCPEGCRQLASDSPVLARLNAGDETPDGVGWVSVWTTLDRTVTPPDSARLEGALNLTVQEVCADSRVGHGQLPGDPLVQAIVLEQLTAGEPVALDTADCARLGG
ncbi:Triacylglycerol esterase/lipase EstA, alpha/beta hydrolase fold [Blastococcus sp. DSM 46786]|uniref:lipase family alpha/beta hydrolase n=1 Tax=Blastococcus sp. DSM 46786 TaxID=1798227 RepID=UPI0008B75C1E|nr:alpha/beta fold hydrolase [Blastococcus sp. DSM 46786]SEL50091.1 Triacylglycerol esterase/lipase EstA, alpha/beta hydrolase fold [Blastococcus sp. DSM 46786]